MEQHSLIKELAARFADGPAAVMLKRGVEQSTTAAGMCERLEGKTLQILPGSDALAAYFVVADRQLRLCPGIAATPDATLSGSPVSLARMSGSDPEAVIREGAVRVTGDTEVAEQFRYLLQLVRPDWEELLSRATGDVVAHEIGNVARSVRSWAAQARRSVGRSVGEYLTEEAAALATAVEIEEFCADVDELTAAVDRLEARLKWLGEQIATARNS